MKLKDIEVGKTYYVRIPKDVDEYLYLCDSPQMPSTWESVHIVAEVLEVGVERRVTHRDSLGGIAGRPSVVSHYTSASDGVKIRFTHRHDKDRVVVVPPRSIQWEEKV